MNQNGSRKTIDANTRGLWQQLSIESTGTTHILCVSTLLRMLSHFRVSAKVGPNRSERPRPWMQARRHCGSVTNSVWRLVPFGDILKAIDLIVKPFQSK